MAHHFTFIYPLQTLTPEAAGLWNRIANNGHLGVSVFFLISGFLITRLIASQPEGLWDPDFRFFYARRIGRLIPLLTLVCLVGAVLIQYAPPTSAYQECLKSPDAKLGPAHWLSIATFSFNWYITLFCAKHPYQGLQWDLLWSLSIEEQFYLFYPLLLKGIKKETALIGFLFFFIVFGLVTRGINIFLYPEMLSYNSFQNFDMIALGCLLFVVWNKWSGVIKSCPGFCFFLCCSGLLLGVFIYFHIAPRPELWSYWFGRFLLGVGAFMFLLGAMSERWFETKYLKLLALPGRLSYGMYLLHPLVLYFAWNILRLQSVWVSFLIFVVVTTLVAYGSFKLFEMPMNFWIRKRLS